MPSGPPRAHHALDCANILRNGYPENQPSAVWLGVNKILGYVMHNDGSHERFNPSNLTRRQVLQRFGMVGTSSLMMGAMGAWDLMGQPAGPRPRLFRTDADAKVIVLGGGLAGLVVGYELGKLGYDIRILEARDRVGGFDLEYQAG